MNAAQFPRIESLRFEGVSFKHENHDPTLQNCDFEFPTGRVVWFKSPEGAGKSTLLQIMAGLLLPDRGAFYMNDKNVIDMSFEEFLPYRLQIGFTFDYGGLINNRSIEDNLLLPLLYHKIVPEGDAHARVRSLVERFEIKKFANERPAHVPGRVRKLAVLLRGLVTHPQVLLLDDPSVGLGEGTQNAFVDVLNEMRAQGHLKHIFISSYDERFMSLMSHDIVHLDGGLLYHQPGEEAAPRAVGQ
ncbi:MAG: ATP-binding cassette domain-containing protein [Bdellovibrionaceae bacterium]|nr:ATP-binding cassette domain-containing protein [Pseudobdellovibrionaceae bacterium]